MGLKIMMPEMGEGVTEGTVSRWLKQVGDAVEQYEPILEIETDKVTTEATAEMAGTLLEVHVAEGQTVPVGTLLAYVGEPGEKRESGSETEAAPVSMPESSAVGQPRARAKSTNGSAGTANPYRGRISPVVGRIAGEHNVDLNLITGTGRDGRITKKDVLSYLEDRGTSPSVKEEAAIILEPAPSPSRAPEPVAADDGQIVPLSNMRRAIAEHMVRSKHTSPHVTTVFEFDFSAVAAHRAAHKAQFARDGARLTFLAYLFSATVQALKAHPMANSSWSDDGILLKREINIGMATALTDGLIVPVIKNADSMNLLGLARASNSLADRARSNQLQPTDVQGGTFTITNHGSSGSLFGAPIINQPQCGILGMGKIEKRVKVIEDAIAIRPLAYVSFTFDHRILDGATADAFVNSIKERIENW
jgi:2-oxoglutarate dehydrogenase E2 component (dihydrolipoamide succinyltransferase)